MQFFDRIRYFVAVDGSIRHLPYVGASYSNHITLTDAKEYISEMFLQHSSYDYAEIHDRETDERFFRTRWDSVYKKVKE